MGRAGPVQTSEALAQGVKAGALSHQPVEVQVRTHLQALGGNDEAGPAGRLGTVRQMPLPAAGGRRTFRPVSRSNSRCTLVFRASIRACPMSSRSMGRIRPVSRVTSSPACLRR